MPLATPPLLPDLAAARGFLFVLGHGFGDAAAPCSDLLLLEAAVLCLQGKEGRTKTLGLLHAATTFSQLEMVRELLKRGASVDLPDGFGSTALMEAAYHGNLSILLVLLQHSASPNLQDINSGTALMSASSKGHDACVKALLRAKANTELHTKGGNTALQRATRPSQSSSGSTQPRWKRCRQS
eukprot:scaffold40631_cov71-Phaeocystis_antarctica.AAC.3